MRQSAFSIRQRMALDACTECGQCLAVCPAVAASGDADLSAQVRMGNLKKLLRDRNFFWRALCDVIGREPAATPERLKEYGTSVFRCSLCGDCEEICPAGLPLKDLWLSLREELSRTGDAPEKIRMIRTNLEDSHNVFAEDNDERGDWVDDMRKPPKGGGQKVRAEVVYFTGCVGAYFPLAQKIPMAFVEILEAASVDFTIMAGDDPEKLQKVYDVSILPIGMSATATVNIPLPAAPHYVRLSINGYARVGVSTLLCRTPEADTMPVKIVACGGNVVDARHLLDPDRKAAFFNEPDIAAVWRQTDPQSDNFVLLQY